MHVISYRLKASWKLRRRRYLPRFTQILATSQIPACCHHRLEPFRFLRSPLYSQAVWAFRSQRRRTTLSYVFRDAVGMTKLKNSNITTSMTSVRGLSSSLFGNVFRYAAFWSEECLGCCPSLQKSPSFQVSAGSSRYVTFCLFNVASM